MHTISVYESNDTEPAKLNRNPAASNRTLEDKSTMAFFPWKTWPFYLHTTMYTIYLAVQTCFTSVQGDYAVNVRSCQTENVITHSVVKYKYQDATKSIHYFQYLSSVQSGALFGSVKLIRSSSLYESNFVWFVFLLNLLWFINSFLSTLIWRNQPVCSLFTVSLRKFGGN